MSTDDWVMPLMSLCVLTTAASAPAVMASTGSSGQKRRCGPHAWSATNGRPAACARSAIAAQVGAEAVVGGGGDEHGASLGGAAASAFRASAARTLSGMPQSGSMAGSMYRGIAPEKMSPASMDLWALRGTMTVSPGPHRASSRACTPLVEPLTRNQVRSEPHASAA